MIFVLILNYDMIKNQSIQEARMDKKKKIIIGVVIAVVAVAAVVLSIVLAKAAEKKRKIKCMWKKSRQSAAMMRGQRTVFPVW